MNPETDHDAKASPPDPVAWVLGKKPEPERVLFVKIDDRVFRLTEPDDAQVRALGVALQTCRQAEKGPDLDEDFDPEAFTTRLRKAYGRLADTVAWALNKRLASPASAEVRAHYPARDLEGVSDQPISGAWLAERLSGPDLHQLALTLASALPVGGNFVPARSTTRRSKR